MISRSCRTSDVLQETMLLRKKKDLMQKDRIPLVWKPKHFLLVFLCVYYFFSFNTIMHSTWVFAWSLGFCVVFCRSLLALLSFFFWLLCCLFFFDLRLLITLLISSNFFSRECLLLFQQWTQLPYWYWLFIFNIFSINCYGYAIMYMLHW